MIMVAFLALLGAGASFEERMANPPAEARILPIVHILPDEPAKQDELFDHLRQKGCGGITTNVGFQGGYVESEERWQVFLRGVSEAKRRGMSLWLYDERGYPSGNAGGITLRDHPEWEAHGLLAAQTRCGEGPVSLDLPPGTLWRATAYPVKDGCIDAEGAVDVAGAVADGKLSWHAPAGSWYVLAVTEGRLYEGTHAALSLADKLPYINLLMAEPTARFIEVTHQQYANRLDQDLGKYFVSTFTDEPSLMSLFLKKQAYVPLPWAPQLSAEFQARRGYALEPSVPALFAAIGPNVAKVRYDYWRTVGELVSEHFCGQIQDWCHAHHVLSGGHLLMEEDILTHVPLYGDFYRCLCRLDAPSMDCLTSIPREVPWYVARLIGSVADIHGRAVTMCETSDHSQRYRPQGDTRPVYQVSEDEIRGTFNRLIMNGINTITSYYVFAGLSDEQLARLNEWVGRCCTALTGGYQVTDIAVVYPVESLWTRFAPSREWVKEAPAAAQQIKSVYRRTCSQLYEEGRDFTILDGQAIADARVHSGRLDLNGLSWRVIVLPGVDTLPLEAWRNLERFWRDGGVVVAVGALSANSESEFPSAAVQTIRDRIFGEGASGRFHENNRGGLGLYLSYGSERLLKVFLRQHIGHEMTFPADAPLHATHRRIDGHDVFFAINDSDRAWEGVVSLAAYGAGEQWDPATGQKTALASSRDVPLRLGPYGGMLFRFRRGDPPKRWHQEDSALAERPTPLPEVKPIVQRGVDVREVLSVEGTSATATATLAKSNVDCHLFLEYGYSVPQDLSGARYLTVKIQIPDRQESPASILVVVVDTAGREYYVESGVCLGTAGTFSCVLPLGEFERAGWRANAPEGPLDLAHVGAIRIGWGGLYGNEGDRLSFTATPPSFVR